MMIKILTVGATVMIYGIAYIILSIEGDEWILEDINDGTFDKFSRTTIMEILNIRTDI